MGGDEIGDACVLKDLVDGLHQHGLKIRVTIISGRHKWGLCQFVTSDRVKCWSSHIMLHVSSVQKVEPPGEDSFCNTNQSIDCSLSFCKFTVLL